MYLPNLKSVALPVPEIRGVAKLQTPNLEEGEAIKGGWYRPKERWWVHIGPPYILFLYQHSFGRNFRLQFSVGVANPRFLGKGGRRGWGWYHSKESWWVHISPPYILFLYHLSFARNFILQFSVGVANPQFWGSGDRKGSGMVPFERALVSFYRPFIVTFPLSLRFSEILPLLFSSMPLFPYPTSSLLKISPCSHGSRWIAFWLPTAKVLG